MTAGILGLLELAVLVMLVLTGPEAGKGMEDTLGEGGRLLVGSRRVLSGDMVHDVESYGLLATASRWLRTGDYPQVGTGLDEFRCPDEFR